MVALLFKKTGQTRHGDAAGICLGSRLDEVGFYTAVDRDTRLGGMRDRCVGPLGEQTLLRQLVKEGRGVQILVVGSDGPRAGRLEVNEDDVALLGLGGLCKAGA